MALLTDVTLPESHEMIYVHAIFVGLALFLFCSDIFVRCRHRPEPAQVNSSPTITNTIPFSTLNISIGLALLANLTMRIFAKVAQVNGLLISLLLVGFILTNKKARKHLRHRLRQKIDTFTIGRGNSIQPVVSVALVQLPAVVAGVSPIPIRVDHP